MKSHQFNPNALLDSHFMLVIHGNQPCLIEQSKDKLNNYLKNFSYIKKAFSTKSADDMDLISSNLTNQSLFEENKWLLINYEGEKLSAKNEKLLSELPNKAKKNLIITLIVCHPDKPSPKSKWFTNLCKQSLSIDCGVLYGRDLLQWQESQLKENTCQLSAQQKRTLCQHSQHSMNDFARISKHLGLAYSDTPINDEEFQKFLHNFSQTPTFNIINQSLNGNLSYQNINIDQMHQEDLIKLYWQLAKTIRSCRQVKELCKTMPIGNAYKELKITPWQQKNLTPSIHRHSLIKWYEIQYHHSNGDGFIKGQTKGNLTLLLEQTLLLISGKKSCQLPS